MSVKGEIQNIEEAEDLLKSIDNFHRKIEAEEKEKIPKEHKAVKEDIEKFKNGDISEDRMRRILDEFKQEEKEQKHLIETEGQAIQDTRKALRDIEKTIEKIKQDHNNEIKAMEGVEDVLGSIANADNFKQGMEQATSQIWDTVKSMDTDVDEEAEMSKDLNILSTELGKTVKEEEELAKSEKQEYQLEEMAEGLFAKVGSKKGEKEEEKLEQEDKKEYEKTEEEYEETEELAKMEEQEVKELISELDESKREAKRMRGDIQEAMEDIKGSPAEDYGRMRELTKADRTLKENIQEVKKALRQLKKARKTMSGI